MNQQNVSEMLLDYTNKKEKNFKEAIRKTKQTKREIKEKFQESYSKTENSNESF